jgi:hypothetical protein
MLSRLEFGVWVLGFRVWGFEPVHASEVLNLDAGHARLMGRGGEVEGY